MKRSAHMVGYTWAILLKTFKNPYFKPYLTAQNVGYTFLLDIYTQYPHNAPLRAHLGVV